MSYIDTIGRWGLGNIDLNNRIVVVNPDHSISTELSFTVGFDDCIVLLPSIVNGVILEEEEAIQYYLETGEHLGKFTTDNEAEEYAQRLHERQEWYYAEGGYGMQRPYSYDMGLMIGSTAIPDVAKWTYQIGDLDTSGSRDATGLLHRSRVATKINYEFSWNGLEWEMLQSILTLVSADKFQLTAPDPRNFNNRYTGTYYVGDRTGDCQYFIPGRSDKAVFSLKLKFIEY